MITHRRRRITISGSGFSLVEVMAALGLVSVLGLSIGAIVTNSYSELRRANEAASFSSQLQLVQKWLGGMKSGGTPCAQILQTSSGEIFNSTPGGRTNAELREPGGISVFSKRPTENLFDRVSKFEISDLYLASPSLVASEATKTIYVATLWIEGKFPSQPNVIKRPIIAVNLRIDNATKKISECNVVTQEVAQTTCEKLRPAFEWKGGACHARYVVDANGAFTCPPQFSVSPDGRCVPHSVGCPPGTIPRGYTQGSAQLCTTYR